MSFNRRDIFDELECNLQEAFDKGGPDCLDRARVACALAFVELKRTNESGVNQINRRLAALLNSNDLNQRGRTD